MEISPNDLLKLPREVALPLLEKMLSELRTAREQTQCNDPLSHRNLANEVTRLKQEKSELQGSLTKSHIENSAQFDLLEERIESDVIAHPAFGFVYEDHEELKEKILEQESEIQSLKTKLAARREKAAERKAEISRLQLEAAEGDNSDKTWRDRVSLLELQLATKDEEPRTAPDEISSLRAQLERLQQSERVKDGEISRLEIQAIPDSTIDIMSFRKKPFTDLCPSLPQSSALRTYSTRPGRPAQSNLPPSLSLPHGIISLSRASLMHHVRSFARTIAILPHQRLIDENNWELITHPLASGDIVELTIQLSYRESIWIYAGRYKCLFFRVAPPKTFWPSLGPGQQGHLVESTLGHRRDFHPRTKRMVTTRYESGTLQIDCFGLQRVGFNLELDKALHATTNGNAVQTSEQSSEVADASNVTGKRVREHHESGEDSSKRHKGSELEAVQGE